MSRTFTVTELTARVRQYADIEHMDSANGFITDTHIMNYLSDSYAELYDILVSKGIGQFESTNDFSGASGQTQALPSDFYAALFVNEVDGDRLIPMREVYLKDVHRFSTTATTRSSSFRIVGSNIAFYPPPNSGTYRLYYAPTATKFSSGSDTVDGVNGWEEYIVIDTVIKCLDKEETSTERWLGKKDSMLARIDAVANNRNSAPPTIHDVMSDGRGYRDPAGWYHDVDLYGSY